MYPRIIELGPLTIHSYGVLLAAAFLSASALLASLAEKDGVPRGRSWDLSFVVILSALAGAKLLMVFGNLGYYLDRPSRLISGEFWQSGGAFFGGLIGALIGSIVFIWRDPRLKFWVVADAAAPAIALGQAIGRLGCFAAGCDYGTPSNLPWAVTFTNEYAGEYVGVPLGTPLHPVQLYESVGAFLLFLFLFRLHGHRRFMGQVFCAYGVGYGILRFCVEFFRGDVGRGFVFDHLLSIPQVMSLLLLVGTVVVYLRLRSSSPSRHRV